MPGRIISHYQLEALLGEGAMGRVYRARDTILERRVALKLVGAASPGDPAFLERFLREARLAAQLNHPNIATVFEFGDDHGEAFLVMELVDGETLADRLLRGPLVATEVRRCGAQAASALAAAHAKGIVHRDIKPSNLMLTRPGLVKVMDFGIARRTGDVHLTTDGMLIGTPKTMAPEILRGLEPGPPADLFSLGCVLYEALAGQPPFVGRDAMAVLYQIAQAEPPPLASLRPEAPADLVATILGLLEKDPARRLGPAAAVAAALGGEALSVTSGIPPPLAADETIALTSDVVRSTAAPSSQPAALWRSPAIKILVILATTAVSLVAVWNSKHAQSGGGQAQRAQAVELTVRGKQLADRLKSAGLATAPRDSVEAARGYFERAARADPTYAVPWNNLGDLSYQVRELQRAERELRTAIQDSSTYGVAHANLAMVCEELGRLAEAEAEYRRAMADDSTLATAPNNLAHLLASQGRHREAAEVLRPALQRWPQVAQLWKNYGNAMLGMGELEGAEAALLRSLELEPKQGRVMGSLAQVAERRGRVADAVERWLQLIDDPDSLVASAALAKLDSLNRIGDGASRHPARRLPVLPRELLRRRLGRGAVPPAAPAPPPVPDARRP